MGFRWVFRFFREKVVIRRRCGGNVYLVSSKFRDLINKNGLTIYKKAGKLYFFRQEIEQWIKSGIKNEKIEGISFNPRGKFKDQRLTKV